MNVFDAIMKRRSTRKFNNNEISNSDIDMLLKCAMAAPSACNKKPWLFYVIKDRDIQLQLRKVSRYSNYESSLMIIVAGDDKRALSHKDNDFWIQDCSAAVENILLAATGLGIATCWCGLYPMITPTKNVRKILNLDERVIPLALIHLGYSDEPQESRTQYDEKRIKII